MQKNSTKIRSSILSKIKKRLKTKKLSKLDNPQSADSVTKVSLVIQNDKPLPCSIEIKNNSSNPESPNESSTQSATSTVCYTPRISPARSSTSRKTLDTVDIKNEKNELIGKKVKYVGTTKKYKDKIGEIINFTKERVKVSFEGGKPVPLHPKSLSLTDAPVKTETSLESANISKNIEMATKNYDSGHFFQKVWTPLQHQTKILEMERKHISSEDWRISDSLNGGHLFGGRRVVKTRLQSVMEGEEDTFLSFWLQNRCDIKQIALNQKELSTPFDKHVQEGTSKYTLISVKIQSDGDVPSFQFKSPKCVHLAYAQVEGQNLTKISLQKELENIANFGSLNPRKAVARLELFQSPAYKFPVGTKNKIGKKFGIFTMDSSNCCMIREQGHEGCGFIEERFLEEMLGDNVFAKRIIAIQVRLFAPSIGIFKGMLCKKKIPSGPLIQLPSSMQKVGPSITNSSDNKVFLLVNKNGVHPNQTNQYIGRLLNSKDLKAPPKSFDVTLRKKELSSMIARLLQAKGVPDHVCSDYVRASKKRSGICHAFVVGLADPTEQIPSGQVFVSGMKEVSVNNFFVTRCPCIEPDDGQKVPMVSQKPKSMTTDNWEWLNKLPFGAIIFGKPKEGEKPLPSLIAGGDLDGDLYFVCWNETMIEHLKMKELTPIACDEVKTDASASYDPNWLDKAQQMMVDVVTIQEVQSLLGKLYNSSIKVATDSKDFMHDSDAIALGRAFKQALDFGKHGGKIDLPTHLHDRIPRNLHKYIS